MTRRVHVLWVPAVGSIVGAEVTLLLLTWAGTRPCTIPVDWLLIHSHHPLQFYVPWLVSFVLAPGLALAVGLLAAAVWSRRARPAAAVAHPLAARA